MVSKVSFLRAEFEDTARSILSILSLTRLSAIISIPCKTPIRPAAREPGTRRLTRDLVVNAEHDFGVFRELERKKHFLALHSGIIRLVEGHLDFDSENELLGRGHKRVAKVRLHRARVGPGGAAGRRRIGDHSRLSALNDVVERGRVHFDLGACVRWQKCADQAEPEHGGFGGFA